MLNGWNKIFPIHGVPGIVSNIPVTALQQKMLCTKAVYVSSKWKVLSTWARIIRGRISNESYSENSILRVCSVHQKNYWSIFLASFPITFSRSLLDIRIENFPKLEFSNFLEDQLTFRGESISLDGYMTRIWCCSFTRLPYFRLYVSIITEHKIVHITPALELITYTNF